RLRQNGSLVTGLLPVTVNGWTLAGGKLRPNHNRCLTVRVFVSVLTVLTLMTGRVFAPKRWTAINSLPRLLAVGPRFGILPLMAGVSLALRLTRRLRNCSPVMT